MKKIDYSIIKKRMIYIEALNNLLQGDNNIDEIVIKISKGSNFEYKGNLKKDVESLQKFLKNEDKDKKLENGAAELVTELSNLSATLYSVIFFRKIELTHFLETKTKDIFQKFLDNFKEDCANSTNPQYQSKCQENLEVKTITVQKNLENKQIKTAAEIENDILEAVTLYSEDLLANIKKYESIDSKALIAFCKKFTTHSWSRHTLYNLQILISLVSSNNLDYANNLCKALIPLENISQLEEVTAVNLEKYNYNYLLRTMESDGFIKFHGNIIAIQAIDEILHYFKEIINRKEAYTTISQIKSTKDSGADEFFKSEDERVYTKVPDLRRDLPKNKKEYGDEVSFKSGNWYTSFKCTN